MKKTFFAFLLLPAIAFAQVAIKPITQINDVNRLDADYYAKQVTWFQGDSIRWDVYARDVRTPIDFTGQAFPVLYVAAETNRQQVYIARTGTVVSATNGHVRVEVPATGATLSTSINYSAWMTVFRAAGGSTAEIANVAYNAVKVLPSPLGVTYTNVTAITNFSIDVTGILTEYDPIFTASVARTITAGMTSQWSTAYGWGNWATNAIPERWSSKPATQTVDMAQQYATNIGGIDFDETPSGAIQPARAQWEASRATVRIGLNSNVNNDLGQQLMVYAKSIETNTINKGEVVLVFGSSGDNPTIKRASHVSEALSSRTIGLASENIASNNNGFVVTAGTAYNLNTTNFTQGAALYLGANGTLQTNLPTAPLHGVFIGTVERVGANNGQIYVHIQNYQELEELSDINVSGRSVNDLIRWNGSVWTNSTETDPLFVAASNSIDTRITANATGKVDLAVYTTGKVDVATYAPATQSIWSAINGIVSADNALTNVTASGRITAIKTSQEIALTFDASGLATGTPIYSVAGLATGMPLYAFTETDTIATNRLTNYYTITSADAKFATGTPLFVENDPAFTNFVALGGTINGNITAPRIKAGDATTTANDLILQGGAGTLIRATGNVVIASVLQPNSGIKPNTGIDLQLIGGAGSQGPSVDSGNVIISGGIGGSSEGQIYATSVFNLNDNLVLTNSDIFMFGSGAYGLKLRPDSGEGSFDGESKRIYLTSRYNGQENTASIFKRKEDSALVYQWNGQDRPVMLGNAFNNVSTYQISGQIDLLGKIRLVDSNNNAVGWITSTGGVQIGQNSFYADLDGDISQDATNTASLGIVSAVSLSGNHIGNAANLTNFPALLATTTSLAAATSDIAVLQGYTNRAASALSSSVWASADSTTNYASRVSYVAATNTLANRFTNYLPLAGGTMSGNLDVGNNAITNINELSGQSSSIIDIEESTFFGPWDFDTQPTIPGYLTTSTWATADSTTNYASRITFNSTSNAFNTSITAVETYTNRAASALSSSVWANASSTTNSAPLDAYTAFTTAYAIASSTTNVAPLNAWVAFTSAYATADSVTNYASRSAFVAFTNSQNVGAWSSYAATQDVNMATFNITNATELSRNANAINLSAATFTGSWTFNSQPTIPGYLTTNGSAAGLTAFPSSLLTVSSGNTNYLRYTSANPTNAGFAGNWNQFTYTYRNATSIVMKVYGPSNKWYGIILNELPIE